MESAVLTLTPACPPTQATTTVISMRLQEGCLVVQGGAHESRATRGGFVNN